MHAGDTKPRPTGQGREPKSQYLLQVSYVKMSEKAVGIQAFSAYQVSTRYSLHVVNSLELAQLDSALRKGFLVNYTHRITTLLELKH